MRAVVVSVTLARRLVAEGLGTALLVAAVVGSGVMAQRLAGADGAVALLANTIATGAALVALIFTFGPVSGAHFNPVVTACVAAAGELRHRDAIGYVLCQLAGGLAGAVLAHAMFDLPLVSWSTTARSGTGQVLSEAVATFGLVGVVWSAGRHRPAAAPFAVAAYIMAAYWFTASTSFANPAVTLARAASATFAGIRPADVPAFVVAQVIGGGLAWLVFGWLVRGTKPAPDASR